MNKTIFQILAPIFLISTFLLGSLFVFPAAWAVFNQMIQGQGPAGIIGIIPPLIYVLFILVQLTMLLAAYQLYRNNNASLFRKLLYISIPSFNLMGVVFYSFVFGPSLIFTLGIDTQSYALSFAFNLQLFSVSYDLFFAGSNNILSIGINILPIILLKFMTRWGY